jgi:predicted HTH transcriptional regulator
LLLLGENNVLRNRELHIHFVVPENVNVTDVTDNVTDRTSRIITLIKENNHISTAKMATILSVSKRTILGDDDQ